MKPQKASLAVSVKGPQVARRVLVAPPSRTANTIETRARTRRAVADSFMESSLIGEATLSRHVSQGADNGSAKFRRRKQSQSSGAVGYVTDASLVPARLEKIVMPHEIGVRLSPGGFNIGTTSNPVAREALG